MDLGWCILRRAAPNRFEIAAGGHTKILDLTPEHEQSPPYPVTTDLTPSTLVKFGVEVLGGSTGFSATQASSGMALCHNGNYLLVDAIPFLNAHLRARGIARNQVHALFLSHIHDDHCNLLSLLQYNRRIQVLTTPVIWKMMLRKLSLLMDRPEDSLQEYFVFIPLTPGLEVNFFGLRITPFYSSHSIPTIGAYFETTHSGKDCRLIFTSDTQALSDLKRLQRTGIISQERYLQIAELYRQPAQLLLADGGEGQIHGDPADATNSPAERIVFLHLDNLSEKFQTHFCTASSGKRFTLLRGETDYNLTRTIEFLLEYFPGMPPVWISSLLASQRVMSFNAGDIIIREGTRSEGHVYMILTGYAQVIHHDGERKQFLAQMEAGELIGEMAVILSQGQRNASVVALSPVTVTAFAEGAFREFIRHQGYESKLKVLWQNRELLQSFPYLRALQQPVLRELATLVSVETISTVPHIIRMGGEEYAKLGVDRSTGTRIFSVSGNVVRPGNYEVELGMTFRELIDGLAGGVTDGRRLKFLIPGGASSQWLVGIDEHLDAPLDMDYVQQNFGVMLGSGAIMVFDETVDPVLVAWRLAKLFAHESCGKCTPCREGTDWLYKLLHKIESGQGEMRDIDLLASVATNIGGKTLCAFGDAAVTPVLTTLKHFRHEYEAHVREGRCTLPAPWRARHLAGTHG